jgi:endonuclease/exonuclease/phosphatase family metal-dependent hydrolase
MTDLTRTGIAVDRLLVATLNILNIVDRWQERLPLLMADMAALQPDLLGLQEVVYPVEQDRVLAAAGAGRYAVHRGWAQRPEWGNSLLVREPLAAEDEGRLGLGEGRAAHRVRLDLPGGASLTVAVTHLHHTVDGAAIRDGQARRLVDWLDAGPASDALIAMGDFNADPAEPAYARMVAAGFRSAYREANGAEPAVTWPSGLQAPAMDTEGEPGCIDYVWVRGAIAVESARLVFDRPSTDDHALFPSDHFGVAATLSSAEGPATAARASRRPPPGARRTRSRR